MLHTKFCGNWSTGSGEEDKLLCLYDTSSCKSILEFLFLQKKTDVTPPPLFSSPEPLGSQGELIVYPSSRHPSVHHFQTSSPLKLLGQSKPNFMWSLLGKGEPKFI